MSKKIQSAAFILAIALIATTQATKTTAQAKSFAYRTSSAQTFSNTLGITCVPAYVLLNKVANQGIFVVSAPTTELGRRMNLVPGTVLLTVDNYSMVSAKAVDSWLAHRSKKGPISFTVAVDNNGQARVQTGSVQPDSSTAVATSAGSTSAGTTSAGASSGDPHAPRSVTLTSGSAKPYLLTLLNKSRATGGLAPLQSDATLAQYAQTYASYLANNASKYDVRDPNNNPHQDLNGRGAVERAQQAGITNFQNENIGRNVGGLGLLGIKILHDQMMESAGHRPAIMDSEAHLVGIGASQAGDRLFLVEVFGR
ncbi:MAG: hypothetical protein HYX67_12920 [Candidatus Melainabacteria bacterium]|nr:hypothetical protein [Candidatus Melainabacteria bacterium]